MPRSHRQDAEVSATHCRHKIKSFGLGQGLSVQVVKGLACLLAGIGAKAVSQPERRQVSAVLDAIGTKAAVLTSSAAVGDQGLI